MSNRFGGLDELVVGSTHGTRSFKYDKWGRLFAPQQSTVWLPGENIAKCGFRAMPEDHDMKNCACGFYAYYNGVDSYSSDGTISAVVEGYGKTQVGPDGFRASKAKIVAVADIRGERDPLWMTPVRWAQRLARHSDGWWFSSIVFASLVVLGAGLGSSICFWPDNQDNYGPTSYPTAGRILLLIALIGVWWIVTTIYAHNTQKYKYSAWKADQNRNGEEIMPRIIAAYPDVKVYDSFDTMVEDYELVEKKEEKILTPDDPDFWKV